MATEIAHLGFEFDTRSAVNAARALDQLAISAKKVEEQAAKTERAQHQAAKAQADAAAAAARAEQAQTRLAQAKARTTRAAQTQSRSFVRLSADTLAVVAPMQRLNALLGTFIGIQVVRRIVEMADAWTVLGARVNLVSGSHEATIVIMDRLYQAAQRTRTAITATAELYTRVARNAGDLGRSQEELLLITELLQKAIRVGGSTAQEAASGVIQLSQAIASGTLQSDELRSVMENMPGVMRVITQALGITVGEFRKMAREGKITAEVILDSFLKMRDQIDRDFMQIPATVGDAFTLLGNAFQRFIGQQNEATGVTALLAEGISNLARMIDELGRGIDRAGVGEHFEQIAMAGAMVIDTARPLFAVVAQGFTGILGIFNALPPWMRELGLIGALLLGPKFRIALFAVGVAKDTLTSFFNFVVEKFAQLDRLLDSVRSFINIPKLGEIAQQGVEALGIDQLVKNVQDTLGGLGTGTNVDDIKVLNLATFLTGVEPTDAAQQWTQKFFAGLKETREIADLNYILGLTPDVDLTRKGPRRTRPTVSRQQERVADRLADLENERQKLVALAQARDADEAAIAKIEARYKALGLIQDLKLKADSAEAQKIMDLVVGNAELSQSIEQQKRVRDEAMRQAQQQLDDVAEAEEKSLQQFKEMERERDAAISQYRREIKEQREQADAAKRTTIEYDALTDSFRVNDRELQILIRTQEIKARIDGITTEQARQLAEAQYEVAEATQRAQDLAQKQMREAERLQDLLTEPFKEAVRSIQNLFADTFEQLFSGELRKWEDFAGSIKKIFTRMLAEIAAAAVFQPLLGGMLAPGGQVATGPGGLLVGGGAASLGGGGLMQLSVPALLGNANFLGMLGAVGGNMALNAILGDRGPISTVGSFLGGVAGAAFGPLGLVGGSLLGNLVGGLFGGKKSVGPTGAADLRIRDGQFVLGGAGGDNGFDPSGLANQVSQVAKTLNDLLKRYNLTLGGTIGGPQFGIAAGDMLRFGYAATPEELIARVLRSGALQGQGTAGTILANTRASDLETLIQQLEFGKLYDELVKVPPVLTQVEAQVKTMTDQFTAAKDQAAQLGLSVAALDQALAGRIAQMRDQFNKQVGDAILALLDPEAAALKQLEDQYEQRRKDAIALGADLVQIERLYGLERAKLIEEQNRAINDSLRGLIDDLTMGPASGLSARDRLTAVQQRFFEVEAKALAGDRGAQGEFESIARQYLEAGQAVFATSSGFQDIRSRVLASAQAILGLNDPSAGFAAANDNVVAELRESRTQSANDNAMLRAEVVALREEVSLLRDALTRIGAGQAAAGGR